MSLHMHLSIYLSAESPLATSQRARPGWIEKAGNASWPAPLLRSSQRKRRKLTRGIERYAFWCERGGSFRWMCRDVRRTRRRRAGEMRERRAWRGRLWGTCSATSSACGGSVSVGEDGRGSVERGGRRKSREIVVRRIPGVYPIRSPFSPIQSCIS